MVARQEDAYSTSFSQIAERMVDSEDADNKEDKSERNERIQRTFMHNFVHSKDVEIRTKQLMKQLASEHRARFGELSKSTEQEARILSLRIFNQAGDLSGESDDETRVFRGNFELEDERKRSSNSSTGTRRLRLPFTRRRSSSLKRSARKATRNSSQSPIRTSPPQSRSSAIRAYLFSKSTNRPQSPRNVSSNLHSKHLNNPIDTRSLLTEPLEPEHVRWFYREASSKKWVAFCGYDSLRLECKYRELAATPTPRTSGNTPIGTDAASSAGVGDAKVATEDGPNGFTQVLYASVEPDEVHESNCESESDSNQLDEKLASSRASCDGLDDEPIIVRGGLHEVHVGVRKCRPIYWNATADCFVMRGTWFLASSSDPLDETFANAIDCEHLAKFGRSARAAAVTRTSLSRRNASDGNFSIGAGTGAGRRESTSSSTCQVAGEDSSTSGMFNFSRPVHQLALQSRVVEWYSSNGDDVWMYNETGLLVNMLPKFGIRQRGKGVRLRRGYISPCAVEDRPADISHLVFVIHGIGQKAYSGAIVKCCDWLRTSAAKLVTEYYPTLNKDAGRVEFMPVEWRNSLKLDGDTVASITPPHMSKIRNMLNSTAMDILYYTSPLYRAELTAGLQHELVRIYTMFCARNPYFEQRGQVSVIAHSLGAVMFYDVLTGWNPVQLYKHQLSSNSNANSNTNTSSQSSSSNAFAPEADETREMDDQTLLQLPELDSVVLELMLARRRVSVLESKLLTIAERQHTFAAQNKFETSSRSSSNGDAQTQTQSRSVVFPKNCVTGCYWKQLPKIANFFCLGSPLSVFLSLRGVRPKGLHAQEQVFPAHLVNRVYNIYHPCDPVAYRLEPLLLKHYATIKPLYVHPYYDALQKTPYYKMPTTLVSKNPNSETSQPDDSNSPQLSLPVKMKLGASDGASMSESESDDETFDRSGMGNFFSLIDDELSNELESNHFSTELKAFGTLRRPTGHAVGDADSMHKLLIASVLTDSGGSCTCNLGVENGRAVARFHRSGCPFHDSLPRGYAGRNMTASSTFVPNTASAETVDSADYTNVDAAELEYRLDYELKDSELSIYLAVLRSHTSYWHNLDAIQFILQHLFPVHAEKARRKPKK